MKRIISLILIFIVCLLQIFVLFSCGNKNNDDFSDSILPNESANDIIATEENTSSNKESSVDDSQMALVRFLTDDGEPIVIKEVNKGTLFIPPTPPRKMGQIFIGWNGNYNNIIQDIDIIANYNNVSRNINVISADTVYSFVNAEFNVLIGIYGEVSFCGLDMDIKYDSRVLELIEVTDVDNCVIQNSLSEGVINMNYVSTNNTDGEVVFMNLKFKSRTVTAQTNLQINVNSMYSLDSDENLVKSMYQVLQNKIIIEEANNAK